MAFEKKPAPGFYDTGAENAMTKDMQQEFRPTTVEEMEGKRRKVGCLVACAHCSPTHRSRALWYPACMAARLFAAAHLMQKGCAQQCDTSVNVAWHVPSNECVPCTVRRSAFIHQNLSCACHLNAAFVSNCAPVCLPFFHAGH